MEHLFIINPKAGKSDRSKELLEKIKSLDTQDKITVKITTEQGEAVSLVKNHLENTADFTRIYACGGDGTANEVLTGMVGFENCAVGVVPLGTGNDFVRSFEEFSKEDFLDIEKMMRGDDTLVDVMECSGRYSMNIMSAGFDSAIAKNVDKFKRLPFVSGSFAYKLSIIYCIFTKRKHRYRVIVDGKKFTDTDMSTLLVVAGKGKYYGGGMKAAPKASLSDGKIDFMHVETVSVPKVIFLLSTYIKGGHVDNPKFSFVKTMKCDSVTFERDDGDIDIGFDGEIISMHNPTIRVIPKAVRVILPKVNKCKAVTV